MTLGALEVDDLEVAVTHLRAKHPESAVALWGRSMGAVTCLLYGHRDPSIAGMVRMCHNQHHSLHVTPCWGVTGTFMHANH